MIKGIQIFKDPLIHFLLAGAGLFVVFNVMSPAAGGDVDLRTIVVDREAILVHVQNTSKMFDPALAAKKFDAMTDRDKENLIDDYVREEVMFREAVSLGLDKEDYVMRRRVIQKLDFITDDIIERVVAVDDKALAQYFESNREDYYVESFVTLTHVFFDAEKHDPEELAVLAKVKKDELNDNRVIFSDAVKHGNRFHYHVNYVERTHGFIQSHFGNEMAKQIFSLTPSDRNWVGPYKSPYGLHLVMLSKKQEGRDSTLDEVRGRVEMDFRRDQQRSKKEETVQKIIETYQVKIEV